MILRPAGQREGEVEAVGRFPGRRDPFGRQTDLIDLAGGVEVLDRAANRPRLGSSRNGSSSGPHTNLIVMCRNIRTLHNFDPPATDEEIEASALQYVRKISGSTKPSQANAEAFDRAVARVAEVTRELLDELVTSAPPKDREVEAAKRKALAAKRYAAAA